MSVLTTLPPSFAMEEVAGIARDLYGLAGTLKPLDSERDQNFRLTESDGTSWVLKIANEAEDSQALAFQAALLRHVQAVDPDLPLPHLRPTLGGEDLGKANRRGVEHMVRLVSWLPGQLYSGCKKTSELHDSLGACLGRLDRALQSFGHAGAHRAFDWDIKQAGRSRARLAFIDDRSSAASSSISSTGSRPRWRRGWPGCARRSSTAMPTTTTCWWMARSARASPA